jgi:hypothetical protein
VAVQLLLHLLQLFQLLTWLHRLFMLLVPLDLQLQFLGLL